MKKWIFVLMMAGRVSGQEPGSVIVFEASTDTVISVYTDTMYVDWAARVIDINNCGLMFNYKTGLIDQVYFGYFGDREAAKHLIQRSRVLQAYKWMRVNRKQYSAYETVIRVNRWHDGIFDKLSKSIRDIVDKD